MTTAIQKTASKHNNWELLIMFIGFIGFISVVCLIISVYAAQIKEKFYPWGPLAWGGPWNGPVSGGPWNIPTRYPIRGWGWDIRGYPAPYPQDYLIDYPNGQYGYPGGRPAYPAPEPQDTESTPSNNLGKSNNQAPFGIVMTRASTTTTKPSTATTAATNNTNKEADTENLAVEEWYTKESKWWPDWVSWPWMPYFNYGLHYDVNGKLKPSDNDSIVANHTWSWW